MEKVSRFYRKTLRGVHRLFRGGASRFRGVQMVKGVHLASDFITVKVKLVVIILKIV